MKLLLILLALPLFTACGGSHDEDPMTNYKSGNCGMSVVSDYNDVILKCKYMTETNESVANCKGMAQSFINKYPGINCTAEKIVDNSVEKQTFTVTNDKFEEIVKALD
jgi:hypothetical protein